MKTCRIIMILLVALTISIPATAGEWANDRDGFVIGFNAGFGTGIVKADGESESGGGGAGSFRLAWAFANQYMIGYESTAWVGDNDLGGDVTLSSHKVNFTWYPGGTGWFARLGFGGGKAEVSGLIANVEVSASDNGGTIGLGGGYEWRLTRTFALGAAIDWNTLDTDHYEFQFINYTAQFNWYF